MNSTKLAPVLFVPHGGGPFPLMNEPGHKHMIEFLIGAAKRFEKPEALIVISAHWEENAVTINAGANPGMLYDYSGFPPETYKIKYPAPGNPELAFEIVEMLRSEGILVNSAADRGYDHGVFVPLKLIYPGADIPIVQISILSNLDPAAHIELGKSLSKIRLKNVLIVATGMTFHNLRAFFSSDESAAEKAEKFDKWLVETLTDESISFEQQKERLINWEAAPYARYCHPREEHLLPLHVCFGIASEAGRKAEHVFGNTIMGKMVSGFLWE